MTALRRLAVLAAAAAIAGGLAGCDPLSPGSRPSAMPAVARAAGVAPSITSGGRTVPFVGLQRWTSASIPALSSRSLTVFAVGFADATEDREVGSACGPPAIRLHTVETAGAVTVLVAEYELPAQPNQACPAVGHLPGPNLVELSAPLGSRAVLTGAGATPVGVLDGERYPDLPSAPPAWGSPTLSDEIPQGVVNRRWWLDRNGPRSVFLETETPAQAREYPPFGAAVQKIDVHGSPATVYRLPKDGFSVRWTPNPAQVVSLMLQDGTGRYWTQADAVRLAEAVTGYRTQPSDRLAQPATPGTVEATFNSADGPIDGVLELLKSSTVYVGLDCEGAGTVDVTVRGAIRPFVCTGSRSHHSAARDGVPHLQFPVSVHATPGVRWALTLAVASLDGS